MGEKHSIIPKQKSPRPPFPLIFQSVCTLWENAIHMFLSFLRIEMFLREYLTSPNLRALPPPLSSVFCITPSLPTLEKQEFMFQQKPTLGKTQRLYPRSLSGSEPEVPKGHPPAPVTSEPHDAPDRLPSSVPHVSHAQSIAFGAAGGSLQDLCLHTWIRAARQ